jgi:hypothetical protein
MRKFSKQMLELLMMDFDAGRQCLLPRMGISFVSVVVVMT